MAGNSGFNGSAAQGGGGGYQGLSGILAALQGNINASQYGNMQAGYNGNAAYSGGTVGGMHGALAGLSPWAVNYLTTSGMLSQNQFKPQDTTGMTGQGLFMANLMNSLGQSNASANPTYSLNPQDAGMTTDQLGQLFAQGFGGHSAYAPGYSAQGRVAPTPQGGTMQGGNPPQNNGGTIAHIHSQIQADNARLAAHPHNAALLHTLAQLHARQAQLRK
jgi:hypothetical protein